MSSMFSNHALRLHSKSDISVSWTHIVQVTRKKQYATSTYFAFAHSELYTFFELEMIFLVVNGQKNMNNKSLLFLT